MGGGKPFLTQIPRFRIFISLARRCHARGCQQSFCRASQPCNRVSEAYRRSHPNTHERVCAMKRITSILAACATAVASSALVATPAASQDSVVAPPASARGAIGSTIDFERAKPMVNSLRAPADSLVLPNRAMSGMPGVAGSSSGAAFGPRAFGSFGIPYTTTRVQLGFRSGTNALAATDANILSVSWPFRAVGKLFFNTPSGSSWCSASVIRRGVIVTAAHCIQRFGSGNTLYSDFVFVPGHYGPSGATLAQREPYGRWTWRALVRPSAWANGTDIGCGAARNNDVAVILLNKNSENRFIGDVVSWFAYSWNNYSFVSSSKTGNLSVAAVTTLGYPFIQDGGNIMQRTDGPTYPTTVCDARQLWQGSNFGGGASGGPWVVNFSGRNPVLGGGAVPGAASVIAVVGVTSWGSADPNTPKDNYSSQFGQNRAYPNAAYGIYGAGNIGSMMNTLCTHRPGGGNLTYAQLGYC